MYILHKSIWIDVDSEEETRFFGLTRECGLHDIDMSDVFLP